MRFTRSTVDIRVNRRARTERLLTRGAQAQPRAARPLPDVLAVFGEISSGLLPTAVALRRSEVEEILELAPGQRAHWRERPISLGVSASGAEGVDCQLAAPGHTSVRAIGTVAVRAVVVGGRVVQSSGQAIVVRSPSDQRMPWSHYLERDGVLEVVTKVNGDTGIRLSEGFLAGQSAGQSLDLTSITERLRRRIGMNTALGNDLPLRVRGTRLRWVARVDDVAVPRVSLRLHDDTRRTALIRVPSESELTAAQRFCEDLALHDWLLTAIAATIERADLAGPASAASTDILATFLQNLAHLWAPGAHTPEPMRKLWRQLQDEPDFTADWRRSIDHLRHRMMVATWHAIRANLVGMPPDA